MEESELRPGCLALKLVQNMPLISILVLWKMLAEQTEDAFYFALNSVIFLIRTGMFVVDIHSGSSLHLSDYKLMVFRVDDVASCSPLPAESRAGDVVAWYPPLAVPMDCSPPGSSVRGILQARLLEWVAVSSSRGSS